MKNMFRAEKKNSFSSLLKLKLLVVIPVLNKRKSKALDKSSNGQTTGTSNYLCVQIAYLINYLTLFHGRDDDTSYLRNPAIVLCREMPKN